ncbi:MAG TPA: class I SAM-dependent methyltransferase [Pseudonocardiaceae bacterium]|nr:class I SAM-dependent methyltransferase [Pseudonocardiaceae bacterium]
MEIGRGEGRIARELTDLGHAVTASDISPSLLAAAEDAGSADRYVLADATSLPFDAHSFDRVVAYNVLMDVPDILPRCLNPHACSHRTAS